MNLRFWVVHSFERDTRPFHMLAALFGLAVAGCAATNVTPGLSAANPASQVQASGLQAIHREAPALRVKPQKTSRKRALYVLNSAANAVQIFTNTYYRQLGAITNGISNPNAETIDNQGNLYVTNQAPSSGDIAEYAPGTTSPSSTYNASQPEGVAVDRRGNIFVADTSSVGGVVNQYAQGVKNAIASCTVGGKAFGVAVDAHGDVFVSAEQGDNGPGVVEFSGGLSNCNKTTLINFQYLYPMQPSLAIDANDDLIFPFGPNVNVIDPPYSAVTRTVGSGLSSVSGVSLNKKNKLLFASDSGTNTVTVINYQTGANVKQLGLPYGISQANGVVDAPNAVY